MGEDSPEGFRVEPVVVRVATRQRQALVCVPTAPPPAAGWTLVLAYHGGRSHPETMRHFSGLDLLAATGRALVCYPAGTGTRESMLTWNGGNCCGEARDGDADDVGFARELVALLGRRYPIDRRRIHATGMSNGAMMAYRLAAEAADVVAAIAPVAGPLALESIRPSRPVPVLHFHGSLDQFTPLAGGVGRRSVTRTFHRGIHDGLLEWVRVNGLPGEPAREPVPCADDGITIERVAWGAGSDAEVILYEITGGGHTWPGRVPDSFYLGPSALSFDANPIIADFFARHPLP